VSDIYPGPPKVVAKLPATVTKVERLKGGMFGVTVAFWDGTMGTYIVPETLATYEGIRISALVFAQLSQPPPPNLDKPHRVHTRRTPRPS
jgi:hypothetical protein